MTKNTKWYSRTTAKTVTAVTAAIAAALGVPGVAQGAVLSSVLQQYIVADSASTTSSLALQDVLNIGATALTSLPAANAVLALLTPLQVSLLRAVPTVTVTPDVSLGMTATTTSTTASTTASTTLSGAPPAAVFPEQTGATQLWSQGDLGSGVNVAVVDTGIDPLPDFSGRLLPGVDLTGGGNPYYDAYGHGTFVAGLIAGNGATSGGLYKGEAPAAGLISVKVAGANGETDLSTVIQGIDWVIANRVTEHIGVMNLSLGYVPEESTVVDPLDQAVERAWQAGIVVVVSAGNEGPFNGTVLSPGDDPLVITVGSVNDHGVRTTSGDSMSTFSSVGPTQPDGWFKPDLVAPGTSVVSLMAPGSTVATNHPQAVVGTGNFVGSGTSFSTAVTSGAVALLLAGQPNLQPDQVKADLLATANPGPAGDPFVDGHGLLNVAAAATAKGLDLKQGFGQVRVSQNVPGSLTVTPGATSLAGFTVQVPGQHPAVATSLAGGQLTVPLSCSAGGAQAGVLEVDVPTTSYDIAANSGAAAPTPVAMQGSGTAPNLCGGDLMYGAGQGAQATFSGALLSSDTVNPEQVQFYAGVTGLNTTVNMGSATAVPMAVTVPGQNISLGTTWQASTWDPASWAGLPARPATASTQAAATGSVWNGSAWNGSVWNGNVWNGNVWNGSVWNGNVWNGSAWNGSVWNGNVWNGSVWNGSVWNGGAWGGLGTAYDAGAVPPAASSGGLYPGYSLVSTSPDLWCPNGVKLGTAGKNGNSPTNGGAGGVGGPAGCGSNGGAGGNGGNASSQGGRGGAGGNGGAGGCPPSTDAEMVEGVYSCDGTGSNGGNGGAGGNATSSYAGAPGGQGGNGGMARNAAGGNGGNGANATQTAAGGAGGSGGSGGGCALFNASYWVFCAANGGQGGNGGNGATGAAGGAGGNGGAAGAFLGTNGGKGGSGGNAIAMTAGAPGLNGTAGGTVPGANGTNGANGANG